MERKLEDKAYAAFLERTGGREAQGKPASWRPGGRTTFEDAAAIAAAEAGSTTKKKKRRVKKAKAGTGFRPRVPADSFVKQRHPEWDFRPSRGSRSAKKKKEGDGDDDGQGLEAATPVDTRVRQRRPSRALPLQAGPPTTVHSIPRARP